MPKNRFLIIADDLTGGADTGAKFAERGFDTFLVSVREGGGPLRLSTQADSEVLVVNTDTRGSGPDEAYRRVSCVLETLGRTRYPVIYKKIDSTLRGNLGREIDALLAGAENRLAFLAPSFPEQGRVVVGGMLLVDGKPLALVEVPQDREGGRESYVRQILEAQTALRSAVVPLDAVAAGHETLSGAVDAARDSGAEILIFDAVRRADLTHVARAAFGAGEGGLPLFVGSAGLAEEVAGLLAGRREAALAAAHPEALRPLSRVLMVCGSKSMVTRAQAGHAERLEGVRSFELPSDRIDGNAATVDSMSGTLGLEVASALTEGHVLLKACSKVLDGPGVSERITRHLAEVVRCALDGWKGAAAELGLILTGGATASSVLLALETEGVAIQGEIMGGIARGALVGGPWDGVTVVTKAGGFGSSDCFEGILAALCGVKETPAGPISGPGNRACDASNSKGR